ncbi:MAG: 16S rRNA (guanine(527)-N(7))-methyltransferase RsmG [Gammaproteobacteria bacterium]|nr:16S rRNA (guanine(527)-N(7))-methyltransferase RsmG [Gammaproteobacteria bacterium]
MEASQRLQQGLTKMGLDVSAETQARLLAYLQLMQKWNRAFNLTAIRDLDQMVIRHLLDSLSLLPHINQSPVLDVGTGAGLPGIPLALCLPDKKFVVLDSNGKKTRFLTQVKIELAIDNIEVIHSRVEDYRPDFSFGIITCRAFSALNTILERTQHLVTSTTRILAMKGKEEIPQLAAGFEQVNSHDLEVAWLDEERRLIEIKSS